jgi:ketosteroid isomerase-like protein
MRLYLSGPQRDWKQELEGRHLLVSYADPGQTALLLEGWDVPGWLVDSGAFTAWTKGKPVDLDRYIAFCLELERRAAEGSLKLDGYFALDVIPGEPHRLPTPEEARAAIEQSRANLARMRDAGLRPIPIYHEGEPVEVLDALVAEGHPVIALGATASRGKKAVLDWLIPLFERHPDQRFHGLAMTQGRLLRSLPFDSVDSTSWLNPCRYGLKNNMYLLKGRTREFWRYLGYDLAPFDLESTAKHLGARGKPVLRQVGIAALLDNWACPPGTPPSRNGQLFLAPTDQLGGVPKRARAARGPKFRPHHRPDRPTRHAPGQLPLFRRRRRSSLRPTANHRR